MTIQSDTRSYERWLGQHLTLVPADLLVKHENMADDVFRFFRATYYRWAKRYPIVCRRLAELMVVLSVGDLHIENFGTWRDLFARLVWGINDFDEAFLIAFTNDLVRLATSVRLAALTGRLPISPKDACEAILLGYGKGLENGTEPFILDHKHGKLRRLAFSELREPRGFWRKMELLPDAPGTVPPLVMAALKQALPVDADFIVKTRRAGEGSLGRERYVALAHWKGGYLAREAKGLAPSANAWAAKDAGKAPIYYEQIVEQSARCPDPCLSLSDKYVVRRLSPDCSRIELGQLAAAEDAFVLLKAMGREVANIHAKDPAVARKIAEQLQELPERWLQKASGLMATDVIADWKSWRASRK